MKEVCAMLNLLSTIGLCFIAVIIGKVNLSLESSELKQHTEHERDKNNTSYHDTSYAVGAKLCNTANFCNQRTTDIEQGQYREVISGSISEKD